MLLGIAAVAGNLNDNGLPYCTSEQTNDAISGISLMSPSCQSTMNTFMSNPGSDPNAWGLQCPCYCELSREQFYGFATTASCATGSSSSTTIEESWIFCNYGYCPCKGAPRTSSAGGTSCFCDDMEQMGSHTPGSSCKAALTCTSDSNCPLDMKCSSRRRKLSPFQKMAARKKAEGRQLFGAPTSSTSASSSGVSTCQPPA